MLRKKTKQFLSALLLGVFATGTQAATISLDPDLATVNLGDQIVIDINMDFTDDATLGGGFDVFFDSTRVSFVSFVFDGTLGSDPSFTREPDLLSGKLEGFAFGNFGGLSGPSRIGTLTFDTLDTGLAAFSAAVTTDPLKGGDFVSSSSFNTQSPNFIGTSVDIAASNVPIPAAVWLFGSGLGLIGIGVRKRG
jgi:hypothetical protein